MLRIYYEKVTILLLFAKTLAERRLNINKIEANKAALSMRCSEGLAKDAASFPSALGYCSAPSMTLAIPAKARHKVERASVFWINLLFRQPFCRFSACLCFWLYLRSRFLPFVYLFPLDAEADGKCDEKEEN